MLQKCWTPYVSLESRYAMIKIQADVAVSLMGSYSLPFLRLRDNKFCNTDWLDGIGRLLPLSSSCQTGYVKSKVVWIDWGESSESSWCVCARLPMKRSKMRQPDEKGAPGSIVPPSRSTPLVSRVEGSSRWGCPASNIARHLLEVLRTPVFETFLGAICSRFLRRPPGTRVPNVPL